MSQSLPTLFVSHGAPDLVLKNSSAREFLGDFGQSFIRQGTKPKAIATAAAHFESATPKLNANAYPGMIYDFGGFDSRLHTMRYPAPGAPAEARQAAELLTQAGFGAATIVGRGYDHGTWVSLMLPFPQAEIPVEQLSVQPHAGAGHHLRVGAALASLRKEGVLIIGSGSTTHNLHEFFGGGDQADSPPPDWVWAFADWVHEKAEAGAANDIVHYRQIAPLCRQVSSKRRAFFAAAAGHGRSRTYRQRHPRSHQSPRRRPNDGRLYISIG
jgi:4,5-DOPA dioxygenase extradiol